MIVYPVINILVGNHRRSYHWCPPPSLPLQAPSPHAPQTHKIAPHCWNGHRQETRRAGGYRREVGQVCMGAETGDEGEAEVTERFRSLQGYVGEEAEAGCCPKSRQEGISMSGAILYSHLYVHVFSMRPCTCSIRFHTSLRAC